MKETSCEVCEPQATKRLTVVAPNMLPTSQHSQSFARRWIWRTACKRLARTLCSG